jgi:hypothetical protein
MNAPQKPSFDELLTRYSVQAQQPMAVSPGFACRVAQAHAAEVTRTLLIKRLLIGASFVLLIVAGAVLLEPTTVPAKYERATRQPTEAPNRLSDWNVDVAKLTERATTPARGLLSSIQRVTLPITSPDLVLTGSLPKLNGVSQAAIDPLTSGPRRAMTLFLRDTGFGSH